MYLAYYDESGDDGLPGSSPLFVLTAMYIHHQNWKQSFNSFKDVRKLYKEAYGLPIKFEFHTRNLLSNKDPYRSLNYSDETRIQMFELLLNIISTYQIKVINVVINKREIRSPKYDILENALKYSITRIENDLRQMDDSNRFMIISDEGRIGKMQKIARKIQAYNPIPSHYSNIPYRNEIKSLIEDPLSKNSAESHFIQFCDAISYVVYL
jgi:hypothetical protein